MFMGNSLKGLSSLSNRRSDGRLYSDLRSLSVQVSPFGFADGSVLMGLGNTKVLCSVNMIDGVPLFLKGKRCGWLTSEYAMMPCSTNKRSVRESSSVKRNSRSVEISRLIGRCFRAVVDLSDIGEKTIHIDCDVLQADGGTRVCAISGASMALEVAQRKWLEDGTIKSPIVKERIAAVSVIALAGQLLLDASQDEDGLADADFNFVMTESGKIIEIQGTGEKKGLDWDTFCEMKELAEAGVKKILEFGRTHLQNV